MSTLYFIVPAPGHYGGRCRVMSSHYKLSSALAALSPGFVVRQGGLRRGAEFLRSMEPLYPFVAS
jgi:hypothetical protein